jgi:hypothetical protein
MPALSTSIPLSIFCIVNLLFIVKYGLRAGLLPTIALCLVYAAFCFAAVFYITKIPGRMVTKRNTVIIAGIAVLASLVVFMLVKVESLRVDRWSVISSFIENLLAGKYPYAARSVNGNPPGPLPFYFVAALPFYLLGEIGLLTLAALAAFIAFLKSRADDDRIFFLQTVLLVTSPAIAWEITARSTIFFNFCLVILYVFWLQSIVTGRKGRAWLILAGLAGGCVLSTRMIAVVPLAGFLSMVFFRKKDVHGFLDTCFAMATGFCLTLAPLLFYGWDSFALDNPIALQAYFLPMPAALFFVLVSFAAGFFLKDFMGWLQFSGIFVFGVIATSMVLQICKVGWYKVWYLSEFDISYFIFCIPFVVASLRIPRVTGEKQAGR